MPRPQNISQGVNVKRRTSLTGEAVRRPADMQDCPTGLLVVLDELPQLVGGGPGEARLEPPAPDAAVRHLSRGEAKRRRVQGFLGPVVQRQAKRLTVWLDPRDHERSVGHLNGNPDRAGVDKVAGLIPAQVPPEVGENARMGDLLALVKPFPFAVDGEARKLPLRRIIGAHCLVRRRALPAQSPGEVSEGAGTRATPARQRGGSAWVRPPPSETRGWQS